MSPDLMLRRTRYALTCTFFRNPTMFSLFKISRGGR